MKDVDGMTEVEKYNYIFKEPFGDVTRFKWITNRLLGDIKTFLKGIEYYIITGKTDSSLGGGNLSVPILVTTALEFVSRLYAGDTGLDFSSGYTSKDNVNAFIEDFFPKNSKSIPQIFWDGIRNGLHHNFVPKAFEYQGKSVKFRFYVEDRRVKSKIEKEGSTIWISINVFELYEILEKAVNDYRHELELGSKKTELQKKFIEAWSSIEEDFRRPISQNSPYRTEVENLERVLTSNTSVPLFD